MDKKFIIIALGIAVCLIIFFIIFYTNGKPVGNEEKAIEIAKAYVLKKYQDNFKDYQISAELNEGIWIVSYGIPPVYDDDGKILEATAGGGGPSLKIKKSNGKVISCLLQK